MKYVTVWGVRVYDAMDVLVLLPLLHFAMAALHDACLQPGLGRPQAPTGVIAFSRFLQSMFQAGRGVHAAADAVHTFYTEVNPDMRPLVPADLHSVIYLLDEEVGHLLFWLPYFILLVIWSQYSFEVARGHLSARERHLLVFAGTLSGGVHALAMLESGWPWLGAAFGGVLLLCGTRTVSKKWEMFLKFKGASILIGELIYVVLLRGAPQPSMYGGPITMAFSLLRGVWPPPRVM